VGGNDSWIYRIMDCERLGSYGGDIVCLFMNIAVINAAIVWKYW